MKRPPAPPLTMRRSIPLLPLMFAGFAVAGWSVSNDAHAVEDAPTIVPCTAKKFAYPKVEKACTDGGRSAVKKLMKAAVKKAKAAGEDINCKSCHTSRKSYELVDGASKRLQKWL